MVSIIVPVYNAEKYIDECIQSVICQTYAAWELLLVDDGSTDNSGNICDKYAREDIRIKVLHQKNQGVSVARNVALDWAKGDYVIFLDSDDFWCEKTALDKLVSAARKYQLDVVRGEYTRVDQEGQVLDAPKQNGAWYSNTIIDSSQFLRYVVKKEFFCVLSLFKAEILKDVRFEVGHVFMEDVVFYLKIFIKQPLRCMYVPEMLFYAYRQYGESASKKTNMFKLRDSLYTGLVAMNLYKETNDLDMKTYLQQMCLERYCSTLKWLSSDKYYKNSAQFISQYCVKEQRDKIICWAKNNSIQIRKFCLYIPPQLMVGIYRQRIIMSKIKHCFLSLWNTRQ